MVEQDVGRMTHSSRLADRRPGQLSFAAVSLATRSFARRVVSSVRPPAVAASRWDGPSGFAGRLDQGRPDRGQTGHSPPRRAGLSKEFSMGSRRTAKVAEAVREQVATTILFGLKDPRVKNVTVTRVEVSPDLRSAKIYVSVMGDEKMQRLTLRGLQSARGFLQAKLAERVQIRYTPILHFELDQGVKRSIEASRLLREVLPKPAETEDDDHETDPDLLDAETDDAESDDEDESDLLAESDLRAEDDAPADLHSNGPVTSDSAGEPDRHQTDDHPDPKQANSQP